MPAVVDLRSDTVTRPTAAMRVAIAEAEVGDDVFADDPTVIKLQETVAALLGKEAALFVPSGTMANQLALRAHCRPGDTVIAGKDAHVWKFESGALAALAGAQTSICEANLFTADDVRARFVPEGPYGAPTRVVAVENTHSDGGGLCWTRERLAEVTLAAHQLGMATHLDGARLWNAAAATGIAEKDLAHGFDSVSVCLSKGLGAPVGSLVCGPKDFITRCHRFRKMYGGGMRQVGILAAAGLHALTHHRARLVEDHANAKAMAEALASVPGVAVGAVQTNIVMIDLAHAATDKVIAAAKAQGVLIGANGPKRLRAVTHLDVDREGCLRAAKVIAEAAA